jgi:large subunit ribosomal protein L9
MATMEILLLEELENLGGRGDIVRVKAGYGRNYLLPRKMAIEATPANKRMIEMQRKSLLRREAEAKTGAESKAAQLRELVLTFDRKAGEHGLLYGSVTSIDIAEALTAKGFEIDRRRVQLKEPIKTEGEFQVQVKLHREVALPVKVVVNPKPEAKPETKPAAQPEA